MSGETGRDARGDRRSSATPGLAPGDASGRACKGGRLPPSLPLVTSRLASLRAAIAAWTPALRRPAIRRVILAFFLYNAVEVGTWTAVLVYAYGATGPASVGLVSLGQLLPSALIAPLLASRFDRLGRLVALRLWYVIMAACVSLAGVSILLGAPPLVVYALAALATLAMTQARPGQSALLPDLARTPVELTGANALASVGEGIGAFSGPLVAGFVLHAAGPAEVYLIGAAALVTSAVLTLAVRYEASESAAPAPSIATAALATHAATFAATHTTHAPRPSPTPGADGGIVAGLREIAHDRDLAIVMVLLTARMAIFGGLEVLVVLLAIDLLGMGEGGAGFLFSAVGVGTIVGGAFSFALAGRPRLTPWIAVGALVVGLPLAAVGILPSISGAVVLLGLGGIGLAVTDVAGQTLLQRIAPDHLRSSVFGLLEGMLLFGEGFGSILVVPVALALGLEAAAITLGFLLPLAAALGALRFARIDRRARVPGHELGLLRRMPLFAPVAPPALEAAARHLIRIVVPAGRAVITQGEAGDRWYLIDTGRFAVAVDGRVVRELGAGDGFGEIALLQDVPRTATVTALDDAVLWALDREEFLAAVTGSGAAYAEARRIASERLAADARAGTAALPR